MMNHEYLPQNDDSYQWYASNMILLEEQEEEEKYDWKLIEYLERKLKEKNHGA